VEDENLMEKLDFDSSIWEKAIEENASARERERKELLERVQEKLRSYFKKRSVKGVYLIGSILKEGGFYEFSDVDIVVEGIGEDYFLVSSELEELLEREVDLIEMERCRFKDTIKRQGLRVV
jgi:predicted nucleotidyltransferase